MRKKDCNKEEHLTPKVSSAELVIESGLKTPAGLFHTYTLFVRVFAEEKRGGEPEHKDSKDFEVKVCKGTYIRTYVHTCVPLCTCASCGTHLIYLRIAFIPQIQTVQAVSAYVQMSLVSMYVRRCLRKYVHTWDSTYVLLDSGYICTYTCTPCSLSTLRTYVHMYIRLVL